MGSARKCFFRAIKDIGILLSTNEEVQTSKIVQIGSTRQVRKRKPIQPGISLIENSEQVVQGYCGDQYFVTGKFLLLPENS